MSVFSKPVSEISADDLQVLLTENAVENLRLEFKREIPSKDESLKKLSAFANTMGGLMVIGADASSSDGRLIGLPGVEPKPGYKQTMVQWSFDGVSPPLDVEVSDAIVLPDAPGRVCYVLGVEESDRGPHFLNGRKGVYVRANEFSARVETKFANDNEFHNLFQRRAVIRARREDLIGRARDRFQTFINHHPVGRRGRSEGYSLGARFELSIGPRFPSAPLCQHDGLLGMISETRLSWRGVGFPVSSVGFIMQHESVIGFHPAEQVSLLEATTWGMLFYATQIETTERLRSSQEVLGIHSYQFAGHVLVFLQHAGVILHKLNYRGPLSIVLRFDEVRGKPWLTFDGQMVRTNAGSQLDDTVSFGLETTAEELIERRDAVAMTILRYVFYAMGLAEAVRGSSLESSVRGGYLYNSWGTTTNLRV